MEEEIKKCRAKHMAPSPRTLRANEANQTHLGFEVMTHKGKSVGGQKANKKISYLMLKKRTFLDVSKAE